MFYENEIKEEDLSKSPPFVADDSLIDEVINPEPSYIMSRDDYIKVLKEKVCRITFTKVDGSLRTMDVTLREDALPSQDAQSESSRAVNEEVVAAYEVNEQHWKSFRIDSVTEVIPL